MTSAEYRAMSSKDKPKKNMRHPEQDFQISLVPTLDALANIFGFFYTHFPSGGGRSKVEAGIFKAMGLKPGCSDFLFIGPGGRAYWIELKLDNTDLWKKTYQSKAQKGFDRTMTALESPYVVCRSEAEVLDALQYWGLING